MKIRSRLGGAPGDDAALGKAGSSSKCEILISSFFSPPSPHIYIYRLHSSSAHCPPTKKPSSNKLFHISFDYIKPLQGSLSLHALLTLSSFCSVSSFLCTIPTTHSLTDVPHCDTRPPLPIFSLHMCWCEEFCVCLRNHSLGLTTQTPCRASHLSCRSPAAPQCGGASACGRYWPPSSDLKTQRTDREREFGDEQKWCSVVYRV